ncbi:hypothetical protein GXP71_15190 [Cellulomonas sp. H30R-01]|uniref:hypothetical protein n=1 Tax=Cellulomonas sp. H30R-01 TaxID=2704467 RepID=UPI00138B34A4|nr:hypothetical protein [Cellulomonas sp. H30R-01]QHT57286.1 hypothetical protein GXP71_15190 [Cellulomonas sp. H30R-01]
MRGRQTVRAHRDTELRDERVSWVGRGHDGGVASRRHRDDPALVDLQRRAGNRAVGAYVERMSARGLPVDVPVARGLRAAESVVLLPDQPAVEAGSDRVFEASGLASPVEVPATSLAAGEGFEALATAPTATAIATVQNGGSAPNPMRLGLTTAPTGFKAPKFDFGTKAVPGGAGPATYTCSPTWLQHMDEGTNICQFVGAGTHKTTGQQGGKDVFFELSAAIAARNSQAEAEHADDIKHARDISLTEAEQVLTDHVIGKTFPPMASAAEAEKKVLDEITAKLTHAGLGNDQTKWAGIYDTLFMKTGIRDRNGWHSFGAAGTRTTPAGIVITIGNGSTSIGTKSSADLITY